MSEMSEGEAEMKEISVQSSGKQPACSERRDRKMMRCDHLL